jgi:hypothetical protein
LEIDFGGLLHFVVEGHYFKEASGHLFWVEVISAFLVPLMDWHFIGCKLEVLEIETSDNGCQYSIHIF